MGCPGFGLAQAIQVVECGVFDVMLPTKTEIKSEAYSHNFLGYDETFSTERPSSAGGAQGVIGVLTRERPVGWGIESTHYHRPDVVICNIVTILTRTPLVRVYLPPSTLEYLLDLDEVLQRFRDPLFLGGLNVYLNEARRLQSQRVLDHLAEYGIIDLV